MVSRESNTKLEAFHEADAPMALREGHRSRIRSSGLRCTPQRLAIYKTLCGCSHPTAEELHDAVSQDTAVSLATVYNTLDVFSSAGLILRLPSRSGSFRYCGGQTSHLHFQLQGSDQLMDVPPDLGEQIMEAMPAGVLSEIENRMGVQIESVDVQFTGSKSDNSRDPDS